MHILTIFEKFTRFKEFDNIIEDIYEQVKNLYLKADKKSDKSSLNIKKNFEGKEIEFNISLEYEYDEENDVDDEILDPDDDLKALREIAKRFSDFDKSIKKESKGQGINAMCYGGIGEPIVIKISNVPKLEKEKNLNQIYRVLTHELSHSFERIKSGKERSYKNISQWIKIHPKNDYFRRLKSSFYLLEDKELYAEGISLVKKFKKYMDLKKSFEENFNTICENDDMFKHGKIAFMDMNDFIKRIDDAYLRLKNGDLVMGSEEEDKWHDTYESCEHIVTAYAQYRNDEFGTKDTEGFKNEMKKIKTKLKLMSTAKKIAKIKMDKAYNHVKKIKTDCYKIYTEK
jgi:hypothetical protein